MLIGCFAQRLQEETASLRQNMKNMPTSRPKIHPKIRDVCEGARIAVILS